MHTITSICLQLKEHKQLASLEAVAKVLEVAPGVVFSGKAKTSYLYSWVVSLGEKHRPADPEADELLREIEKRENESSSKASKKKDKKKQVPAIPKDEKKIITNPEELEKWLDDPENKSSASPEFVFLLEKMAN